MTDPQTDPRFVDVRCRHRYQAREDLLMRFEYVCQFRDGHQGLHFSATLWNEQGEQQVDPPMRWGTAEQLLEEALNMGPVHQRSDCPVHARDVDYLASEIGQAKRNARTHEESARLAWDERAKSEVVVAEVVEFYDRWMLNTIDAQTGRVLNELGRILAQGGRLGSHQFRRPVSIVDGTECLVCGRAENDHLHEPDSWIKEANR